MLPWNVWQDVSVWTQKSATRMNTSTLTLWHVSNVRSHDNPQLSLTYRRKTVINICPIIYYFYINILEALFPEIRRPPRSLMGTQQPCFNWLTLMIIFYGIKSNGKNKLAWILFYSPFFQCIIFKDDSFFRIFY